MSNTITSAFSSALPGKLQASSKTSAVLDQSASAPQSAEEKFLAYAKLSPAEKMRAALLSSIGVTEEQLKNMSPDEQKAIEQKIADKIKQAAQKQAEKTGAGGFFTDIQA